MIALWGYRYYINSDKAFSSVGKALGAFWPGRDTGREPASCVGGRENCVALQALGVTRLCLQVLNVYYDVVCVMSLLRLRQIPDALVLLW
jgi:hypothetical protein